MCTRLALVIVLAMVACGGHPRTTTPAITGAADAAVADGASAPPVDAAAPEPVPVVAPPPVSADECAALVDHLVALGLAAQRARDPHAPTPTDEQTAQIRDAMLASMHGCDQLARATWTCAMAAADRAAMASCPDDAP